MTATPGTALLRKPFRPCHMSLQIDLRPTMGHLVDGVHICGAAIRVHARVGALVICAGDAQVDVQQLVKGRVRIEQSRLTHFVFCHPTLQGAEASSNPDRRLVCNIGCLN